MTAERDDEDDVRPGVVADEDEVRRRITTDGGAAVDDTEGAAASGSPSADSQVAAGADRGGAGGRDGVADGGPPIGELPLPPYPPNLGHPTLHAVRQMRDTLGFTEAAHATRDVTRAYLGGDG